MTKAELVAKLEGVKEFTSVVSIDIVIAALGMLEDPKPATKVNDSFIDEALAQRISEKIERVLDYNTRDIVETDTAEFSLGYDGRTIELETVEINVSEIMRHVDAVLGEFTAEEEEEEEEGTLTDITE
jgi:hypothetical protein